MFATRVNKVRPLAAKLALAAMAVSFSAGSQAQESIDFSGFLSINGGVLDDEQGLDFSAYEEEITFQNNIIGLQTVATLHDDISATLQFTARGAEDYDVDIEWAYLSWEIAEEQQVRIGRLRTPLYFLSDYLDVGFAFPWIEAPSTVYYLPSNNFDGVDYVGNFYTGGVDLMFQAYYGGYNDSFTVDSIDDEIVGESRNQFGFVIGVTKDILSLRAAYHQGDITNNLDPLFGDFRATLEALGFTRNAALFQQTEDNTSTFFQFGFNIDTERFVSSGEYVEFEVEESFFSKDRRGYIMGGVRAGDWLFHLTHSWSDDTPVDFTGGVPDIPQTQPILAALQGFEISQTEEQSIFTLGARWDVKPGVALKFQLDEAEEKISGEEQTVLSFALQAVF